MPAQTAIEIKEQTFWAEHFKLAGGFIESLTSVGKVTVDIFRFNDKVRLPDRGLF